ncbi:MAG: polyprenyl diphosphate synthase [Thermoplasmata archaeon]|nr:polyprenyl diphosphate synthase [Thermoplasmata archaeon]
MASGNNDHKSGIIADTAYRQYEKRLSKEVANYPAPKHVAIIMDGNRRFAKELGLGASEGHKEGRNKLEELLNWVMEAGVKILTVYAFSSENQTRNEEEIDELMKLFEESFYKAAEDERVHKHHVRIRALGMIDILPENVREAITYAEEKTKDYDSYYLNLAVAYSGREEIIQAIRNIATQVKDGKITPAEIDEDMFSKYLYTKEFPDPDLILRTSGEVRVSNFLLWQLAYSELYFVDVYWPGFRKIDFLRAIRSYQQRSRRYGK